MTWRRIDEICKRVCYTSILLAAPAGLIWLLSKQNILPPPYKDGAIFALAVFAIIALLAIVVRVFCDIWGADWPPNL